MMAHAKRLAGVVLAVSVVAYSFPLAAQEPEPPHHRIVEMACGWEADRFCSSVAPDSRSLLRCLSKNLDRLGPRCSRTLKAAAVIEACRPEHQRLCNFVVPGGGRILACLQSNFDRLGEVCSKTLSIAMNRTPPPGAPSGDYEDDFGPEGPVK